MHGPVLGEGGRGSWGVPLLFIRGRIPEGRRRAAGVRRAHLAPLQPLPGGPAAALRRGQPPSPKITPHLHLWRRRRLSQYAPSAPSKGHSLGLSERVRDAISLVTAANLTFATDRGPFADGRRLCKAEGRVWHAPNPVSRSGRGGRGQLLRGGLAPFSSPPRPAPCGLI